MSVRVRFAPSPTGHLHIGGLRTALFNYIFAKHNNGKFLLRVEDTDIKRSKTEYLESQLAALDWANIKPDEPILKQSERTEIYNHYLKKLLDNGKAYKHFTSKEEAIQRAARMKELFGEDIDYEVEAESWVIKFKVDYPHEFIKFNDEVKGEVSIARDYFDDFVIARADGSPTYNFVVVVDDILMEISHVIRGEDHISNTPKQILLYQALGANVPKFAHIPLILNQEGRRLSKRDGATSVQAYQELGYLPEALCNYLARLGWSHGDQEIFSRKELIDLFTLEGVGTKGASFDLAKLNWLNQHYMINTKSSDLLQIIIDLSSDFHERFKHKDLLHAVELYKSRSHTLIELRDQLDLLFTGPLHAQITQEEQDILNNFSKYLLDIDWNKEALDSYIKSFLQENNLKMPQLGKPLRMKLVGSHNAPGIVDLLLVVGRVDSCNRIS